MSDPSGKIEIKGDEILNKHNVWAKAEGSDASKAGTRRELIGTYCEKHGIENKAFSQFRSGLKIKNDGKRKDWLRSLQLLLPLAEAEIFGNEPDMFKPDDEGEAPEEVEAEPEAKPKPKPKKAKAKGDPELAAEAADFAAAANETVTPIDFNSKK